MSGRLHQFWLWFRFRGLKNCFSDMHINQYRLGYHLLSDRLNQPNLGRTPLCFGNQPSVHLGDRLDQPNCRVCRQAAPATQHVALERPAEPALACRFALKKSKSSDITSRSESPVQLVVQVVSMLPIARLKQPTCRYCFMCPPPAAPATRHVALERPAEPALALVQVLISCFL